MALVLGFAVWSLWKRLEAKDAEIRQLNEQNRQALLEIAHRSDD